MSTVTHSAMTDRCMHCHLEYNPEREEMMEWETMEVVISTAVYKDPSGIVS